MEESLLKNEEKVVFALRALYRRYGYLPFRMSKFEEYELYMRNKDFLVSDRIITFQDTDGKLLALKPDVTLSIIKSGEDVPGCKQRVYYNENVYRVSGGTRQYKEIMQAGLECIGDIDLYDIYEVISLGLESLSLISDSFVLEISHLGLLSAVLERVCPDQEFIRRATHFISEKNAHELKDLCRHYKIADNMAELLTVFVRAYGERNRVITVLEEICRSLIGSAEVEKKTKCVHTDNLIEERKMDESDIQKTGEQENQLLLSLEEIKELSYMLDALPFSDRIHFDFSVVNNMNYYNGFVFKGFVDGICDSVLTGGQYDRLMARMGRRMGAAGFALYLDLLEQLHREKVDYDVDVLLLYDKDADSEKIAKAVRKLVGEGKGVSAQREIPEKLRYREIVSLRTDGD